MHAARIAALVAVGCMAAGGAWAQDSFMPYVAYSIAYDDNVFGLPDDIDYKALAGRASGSDTVRTAHAGLKMDYRLSRQRFEASADFSRAAYAYFKALDHSGRDLQATWHWLAGKDFSGTLGASEVRALNQLTSIDSLERNLRRTRRGHGDGAWLLTPSWRLRMGGASFQLDHDLASQRFGNISEKTWETGVDYLARSGNSIGIVAGLLNGRYPERRTADGGAERYRQRDAKFRIDWRYSGKTRLEMLLGWSARKARGARVADFSGPSARIEATWQPSGKTLVEAGLWREVAAADEVLAFYSLNTGASLAPTWLISEKTSLRAALRYEQRDFEGAPVRISDTSRSATLTLSHAPSRALRFQLSAFAFDRNSNNRAQQYSRKGASLQAQYQF
ncbi:XrtB/PEP-CTERM-associated polysaccharide biosynthesis outer membrane protein EpsL [Massilia sp.]|uniref:XrtB/PEP-CTERM-associated polysaccharide biosynthesis outer membrane protein EpsL n=1 Tax=Massilia sp. TaxID=1882437 RepID=UPI00289EA94E|nr:XrtB/PEP-CTERM-associated polysaccharide biosynthesis outer membrane protein EpsL [Massilia sp.]